MCLQVMNVVIAITDWIWGVPMLILLGGGGLFLTIRMLFFQFCYLSFILRRKWKEMRTSKSDGHKITGFQALTAALGNTLGPGNIVGTGVAIGMGGPGALFWMFIVGLFASAVKFCEVVLAMKYRARNENGEYNGGPQMYLAKCFKSPWLGVIYTYAVIFAMLPSLANQAASIADMGQTINLPPLVTGIILLILAGVVVIGGVHRLAKVTEKLVPCMAFFYIIGGLIAIGINYDMILPSIATMVTQAFTGSAAVGGFAGCTIVQAFRWGLARGTGSNDAGNGLAAIVHASTDDNPHPVEQGLWGIVEVLCSWILM